MPPVITLGIETATDVCAVAVLRGDAVLASACVLMPRSHATRLALLVEEALGHARLVPADLGVVAVSAGPGSYTGLRIGASLARGLCLATGARLVGVGTLEALAAEAFGFAKTDETLFVALPSRRGEVYLECNNGSVRIEAQAVALADLGAFVATAAPTGRIVVAGAAAVSACEILLGAGREARALDVRPSAERVARIGLAVHASGAAPALFEPAYIGTFATPPAPRADGILAGPTQ